jgi:hypothetical protein
MIWMYTFLVTNLTTPISWSRCFAQICCPFHSKVKCSIYLYLGPISTTWWKGHGRNSPRLARIKHIRLASNVMVQKMWKHICLTKIDCYHMFNKQKQFKLGSTSSRCSFPPTMATKLLTHIRPQYHTRAQSSPWQIIMLNFHDLNNLVAF